jgi:hypothetical protein
LPDDGAIQPGAEWDIEPEAWVPVLRSGGALRLHPEQDVRAGRLMIDKEDVVLMGALALANMTQEIDGQSKASWSETIEEDGVPLAVIEIELDLELEGDLSETWTEWLDELGYTSRRELQASYERELVGEAKLLWNLERGTFERFRFEVESYVTGELDFVALQGGGEFEVEVEVELNASTTYEADASQPE